MRLSDVGAISRLWRDVPHESPIHVSFFVASGFTLKDLLRKVNPTRFCLDWGRINATATAFSSTWSLGGCLLS